MRGGEILGLGPMAPSPSSVTSQRGQRVSGQSRWDSPEALGEASFPRALSQHFPFDTNANEEVRLQQGEELQIPK